MLRTRHLLGLCAVPLAALCGAGCEDSVRQVRVTVPVEQPPHPAVEASLPVTARGSLALLCVPVPRQGAEVLAASVGSLIDAADRERAAGRHDAAQQEYDRAARWLLSSGYDLRSNPRLEDLYERTLTALKDPAVPGEGEGAEEQQGKPAAIDLIPEAAPPSDPRLKERAEQELKHLSHDLPITVNDPVLSYLNFFETPRGRRIVERGLRRAGRYREMISRVLREEGLPQDLIYVAQAESAFEPLALSRARALGIWQFVAASGRKYGLQHTWWVDERRDPEKSTRAAARYFHDLYNMFGDWYLALAAYNTGEGNVARAVERTAYADFWELHRHGALPRQTRNYVPIILALTVIAKDPARHGIQVEEEQPLQYETVKPGHALDLRLAADAAGTDLETLKALNPQLLRGVTPEDQEFELRLPAGSGEHFSAELKGIPPERWLTWRRHAVSEGETLAGIARHYGVTAEAVREANRLERDAPLEIGTRLTIPANRPASTGLGRMVRYRVRRGDTLASIAREFDVVPSDIEKWNGLHSGRVTKGMTLKVYPGGRPEAPRARSHPNPLKGGALAPQGRAAPAATPQATTHPVRQGETLWSIARAYQTSVEALRAANKFLAERPLHAGDVLVIQAPHQGPG